MLILVAFSFTEASKLVPDSLLPHWNSMWFFHDGITLRLDLNGGSKIRDPLPAKFKHVMNIVTCMLPCCDYVTYVPALWNFQKADFKPHPVGKKYTTFLLSDMSHSLQIFAWGMPYMLMYSALHIMQWFSHILDVFTLKIWWKFFWF